MVAELTMAAAVLLGIAAEALHARRIRRLAPLAFGPRLRPAHWVFVAAPLRVAALGAVVWGAATLLLLSPKVHKGADVIAENEYRHLIVVLDVSPSMRLVDAGPEGKQSRMQRVAELMKSFFQRVQIQHYKISVIAVYNGAKPVVVDTKDREVIRNILEDLPMHFAFPVGGTDLFAGLNEAAKIAKPWNPNSATLLVLSDGDTTPATGMPKLPSSIAHVVVVGVGDPAVGKFIEGHQSRQDSSTLRQLAIRLRGHYHDGNQKHLSSDLLKQIGVMPEKSAFERLTRREYALLAMLIGSGLLSLLPLLLHYFGTSWQPGARNALAGNAGDRQHNTDRVLASKGVAVVN